MTLSRRCRRTRPPKAWRAFAVQRDQFLDLGRPNGRVPAVFVDKSAKSSDARELVVGFGLKPLWNFDAARSR